MKKNRALLDFGSSFLHCALHDDKKLIAYNHSNNDGIRCGTITNLEKATQSVLHIIGETEKKHATIIQNVDLIVGGKYITSSTNSITHAVKSDMITSYDIELLIKASRPPREESTVILHVLPIQWELDHATFVDNPIGLFAKTLTLHTHIIRAKRTELRNIIHVLHRSHLHVRYCIARSLATSLSAISEEEKKNSAIIIDIGGHTTTISYCSHGHLLYAITLPIGGYSLTFDLAKGLGVSLQQAEIIKRTNPLDHMTMIKPRIEEILELAKESLLKHQIFQPNEKFILTGGAILTTEWLDAARYILSPHIRLAINHQESIRLDGGMRFLQSEFLKNSQNVILVSSTPWQRFTHWLKTTF